MSVQLGNGWKVVGVDVLDGRIVLHFHGPDGEKRILIYRVIYRDGGGR